MRGAQPVEKMKIQMIIIKFLILGALFIISNQNLHLGILQEREIFFDTYLGWVTNIASQILDVTGYVIKFQWLPK